MVMLQLACEGQSQLASLPGVSSLHEICPPGANLQPLRSRNMQEPTLQYHKTAPSISVTPSGVSAMLALTSCSPACAAQ